MTVQSQQGLTTPVDPRTQNLNPVPIHRAEDLTRGGSLANIVLSGQVYSLRITRAGKLILTK